MSRKSVVAFPSAAKALAALDQLSAEIDKAPSLAAVEAIANAAAGYQRMFKPVKEVADRSGRVWIAAVDRIGVELEKIGKSKGSSGRFRGKPKGGKPSSGPIMAPLDKTPSARDLGLSKKQAAQARKLSQISDNQKKKIIKKLEDEGKGVTPNAVLAASRQDAKVEKIHKVATAAFSATGPFDVVVIDPPWDMQKIDRDERPNQDAFDYPTMTIDELSAFWPDKIEPSVADDCHLFCWTTQKYLPAALELVEKWGFRYVLTTVWHKPGGFQPIGLPQYNAEFAIYARKGSPVFIDTKNFSVCNEWPRREHSRKPDEFYELIKRVTGGSRLDVFARGKHDGFAQYGNEIDKFDEAAE